MIEKVFGRLVVLSESPDSIPKRRKWMCRCECGNEKAVRQDHLKSGATTSCGCVQKERAREASRNPNRFEIKDDHVVGYANNTGSAFYVDLSDWSVVSKHGWYEDGKGYLHSRVSGKLTRLHRLLLNPPADLLVDHKDRNPRNNRRNNLRLATPAQNSHNQKSEGVCLTDKGWKAYIQGQHLGYFDSYDDAKACRRNAELERYGEFAA